MSAGCCNHDLESNDALNSHNKSFKNILWISLILNLGMFFVEVIYGVLSGSLSLRADALDFLGDSVNYFVTLFFLTSMIKTRARVSIAKSFFMIGFGIWILVELGLKFFGKEVPNAFTMSWVSGMGLFVNALVALLLYKFRDGDSNMKSVWLCSRNDAIGNLAVILASAGVYWWGQKWPDLFVALIMSGLAISAALQILKLARVELKTGMRAKGIGSDHGHHGHHHH